MGAIEMLEALEGELASFPNTVKERQRQFGLKDSYKTIAWVYACTNLIADCIAGVEFTFFRPRRNGEKIEVGPREPVSLLVRPPKQGEIHTVSELIKMQFLHLGLFGESFATLTMKGKRPTDFNLINPLNVSCKLTADGSKIEYWEVHNGKGNVRYKPEDMIQWKYPNPYNEFRGMAPLTAARVAIEQDLNMSTWNAGFFQNGVRNPIALLLKQTFNDTQRRDFLARLKTNFGGFAKGQLPLLVEGGVDVKVLANTMKDLDFVEGKSLTREELCAVYNVPPAQVGIFRYANYANSKEQRNILYQNNLKPKMAYYRDVFQQTVLDRYFDGIKCDFAWDTIDAFREDPVEKATAVKLRTEAAEKLWAIGYDQKQISIIVDDYNFDPTYNKASGAPTRLMLLEEETEITMPEPAEGTPEDEAEDAAEGEDPSKSDAPTFAKAKDHTTIYASERYLYRYAKAIEVSNSQVIDTVETFAKTFFEELAKSCKKRTKLSTEFWTTQWNDGIEPHLITVFDKGYKHALAACALPLAAPKTHKAIDDTLVALRLIPSTMIDGVEKAIGPTNRNAAVSDILSFTEEANLGRIVRYVYNLGRFAGMKAAGVTEHVWCWCGDAHHRASHGKATRVGSMFESAKVRLPGDGQDFTCTCLTYPSKVAAGAKVLDT